MVEHVPVGDLAIVGGNLALDFANTQSGPPGGEPDVESLGGPEDLVAWAARVGILDAAATDRLVRDARRHPAGAQAARERALDLRSRLYGLFLAVANGGRPDADALDRLRDDEADALAHAHLDATVDGAFGWSWAQPRDLDDLRWPIVHAAATLLTTGPLDRVKGCGGCRYLFLDETKNGSRRWCSMADCGTRAKSRRFVARRAATRSATSPGSRPAG